MCLPENVRCMFFLFFLRFLSIRDSHIADIKLKNTFTPTSWKKTLKQNSRDENPMKCYKKQNTHTRKIHRTHGTAPFRKKIKHTYINCMQFERDALRVIKYTHFDLKAAHSDAMPQVWIHRHVWCYPKPTHMHVPRKPFMCCENAFPCSNLSGRVS